MLQQDPNVADETNGFEGDNDALGTANTPLSAPTIYNATLCGKNVDVAKQQYGMLLRRGTRATHRQHHRDRLRGWASTFAIRPRRSISGARSSSATSCATWPTRKTGPNTETQKDDDAVLNELTWFATPERKNSERDPGIAGCFSGRTPPTSRPSASLTEKAATPPSDGFFDTSATYIGAFRDTRDGWASEPWVRWTDR